MGNAFSANIEQNMFGSAKGKVGVRQLLKEIE